MRNDFFAVSYLFRFHMSVTVAESKQFLFAKGHLILKRIHIFRFTRHQPACHIPRTKPISKKGAAENCFIHFNISSGGINLSLYLLQTLRVYRLRLPAPLFQYVRMRTVKGLSELLAARCSFQGMQNWFRDCISHWLATVQFLLVAWPFTFQMRRCNTRAPAKATVGREWWF